jgi:zinc protease
MKHILFIAGCFVGCAVLLHACATPRPLARGISVTSETKAFPFATVKRTLPNGLRVFVVEFDSPGLVAYYSIVRTGSRNEVEPGKSGFAHFFEHMMFRGTPSHPTDKYNAAIKAMGADSNAFTSDDMTVYHILAGTSALPTIVAIEADRFQNLQYAEAEFQKEARAVLGEYSKGASDPMQPMSEALYDNAFQVHTYKHTTIGFLRDIESMPNQFAYSRQFFDRYYRPDNVILLVVGDVTADHVLPLVEKHYSHWQPGPARPQIPVEPPQTRSKRATVPWKAAAMPTLLLGYHTPAFSTAAIDSVALEVMAELVFAERGPLYRKLVLEEQRVEHLEGACDRHTDPNLFHILARVKDSKDIPYVEDAIYKELARVAVEDTPAKALAEVVSRTRYAFASQLSTADRTALVGAEFLALTGGLSAIDETFALLAKVTAADVQRVTAKYFAAENRTIVVLEPEAP